MKRSARSDLQSTTMRRRRTMLVAALVALIGVIVPAAVAASDVPPPTQWPASSVAAPQIESWTNAIRFSGSNREQTSLALALGLRGRGDYPFDTTDPSSGGAPTLATADDWWGVGTCPRAIIVVAGDTPADSLAASSLSDPSDRSTEPFLQRSAAADPLFDPIGGFARVDTQAAPIIVTRSARQGATALGASAKIAARDLRAGGCTLARQAIVVGGTAAVPAGVDAELVSLGYDEVFRVQGANRFGTAAAIASALGVGQFVAPGTPCIDPVVDDGDARMGFYGNAAVELRNSATTCRVLGRTVVLAEGGTGADALAAGWWTSFWQVPVLLHDGSDRLPAATIGALTTQGIDHVLVLGGTARIPETVVDEVRRLTGAETIRIEGTDRYATSVEMARRLGGWWPTGRADEYSGAMVCLAASSGDGTTGRGWPDALGAGPWCGASGGAAVGTTAPDRALTPLTGERPTKTGAVDPRHDAVPVLLVRAGATTLPPSVEMLLTAAFEPTDSFCTSVAAPPGCATPGFVVVAGGESVVPSSLVAAAASIVAGGSPATGAAPPPALERPFVTQLDLGPVYATDTSAPARICVPRDAYVESRWLTAVIGTGSAAARVEADVMSDGRYARDADGVVRSRGVGAPACVSFDPGSAVEVGARGVGIAGRVGPETKFATTAAKRLSLTAPVADVGPDASSGTPVGDDSSNGGSTTQTYITMAPAVGIVIGGSATPLDSASITLTLVRGIDSASSTGVDRFSATIVLDGPSGTVEAAATGEAVFVAGTWHLRGRVTIGGGSAGVPSGVGGFVADLAAGATAGASDDSIAWRLDAAQTS
jgi:putative cell wall-binding protein